jgi:hypothetical protein
MERFDFLVIVGILLYVAFEVRDIKKKVEGIEKKIGIK